jgi:hypothetical protein
MKDGIKEFLNHFKFTNRWNYAQRMQADRFECGAFYDHSSEKVEISLRISIVNIFNFGVDWSGKDVELYITLLNFQLGAFFNKDK